MSLLLLSLFFGILNTNPSAYADPHLNAGDVEVLITQATIQLQAKKFKECSSTLSRILANNPEDKSALEMLALTQKSTGKISEAKKTYEKLLNIATRDKDKEKQPAYAFELGSILYSEKNFKDSYPLFEKAAKGLFNLGASYFFMGVMDFNDKHFRIARKNLSASLRYPDGQPMKIITRYYLASTLAQLGKSDAAGRNYFVTAKEVSEEQNKNKTSAQKQDADQLSSIRAMQGDIRKNSLRELKAMDLLQKYINITMMSQYDSNVQTNPLEVTDSDTISRQKSVKGVLSIAAGIVTSPVRKFQFIPSYRMFMNYNSNSQARDFNFITQGASLYSMYKPYSPLSFGLRTEANHSLKNQLQTDDSRSAIKYTSYSIIGDIGPVIKYDATSKVSFTSETTWRPKHYYLEPTTGDSRRSGHGVLSKLSADYQSDFWWWAPLGYFSFEWDNCYGKTYRNSAWGFGLANNWAINERLSLTGYLDMLRSDYFENVLPSRDDFLYTLRVLGTYSLGGNWNLLADMGYTKNESTQPASYLYQRFVTSVGASYTF